MIESKAGEEFTIGWKSRKRNRRRAALRPHGRNAGGAGEAGNIHYVPFDEGTKWYLRNGKEYFVTRAQAAQAANENFIDSWNRMIRNPEL